MNLRRYLNDSILKIIYFASIVLIVNLVIISSTPLSKSIHDILYLNLLILVVSLFFLVLGYIRWKSKYKEFKNAIDTGENIDVSMPKSDTFEAQLIRETLDIKNKKMYKKTKELENAIDEINDYITKWVHEIKIPISVCEIIADRIGEEDNVEIYNETSQDIRKEMERIKFLVDQVLYASRASSYSEDLTINEIKLDRIIKDAVKKNAYLFISKKIDLNLNNVNFNVSTDKKWISYIIDQILNNACKYADENGRIEIYAHEDEKAVRLSIKDNGIGILPKDIKRVFDKGFTGENGRKTTKSTGMGLYFSKKMVNKLEHDIEVHSEVGQYTEFTIVFYKLSDYFKM